MRKMFEMDGVKSFFVSEKGSFFIKGSQFLFWNGTSVDLIEEDTRVKRLYFIQGQYVGVDSRNIPIDSTTIEEYLDNGARISRIADGIIYYYRKSPNRYGFVDINTKEKLEFNRGFDHKDDNSIYAFSGGEITGRDILTGLQIWSYTLPENYGRINNVGEKKKAEFLKVIGTHNGILWTALYSGCLLGLDAATGKERFYIDRPNSFSSSQAEAEIEHLGIFGFNVQFDKDQEQIFSATTRFYGELNLQNPSGDFMLHDIGDSCREHGLLLNNIAAWERDDVYFYEGSDNNRFGIFSRSKKEIVWSAEIPEAKDFFPAIRKMDYAGNRIYVLDHFNTLHIFEKTK